MPKARVELRRADVVGPVRRRTFGTFVEHLGRCVYDGLYEPGHPLADSEGFRTDVIDLVKELGTTTIRYPGGNFVSGYRWEDGVGPRDQRPRRRELAWHSTETNQIGVDEFVRWADLVGAEVMLAVNLGTRGILEALDLLEYVNGQPGTALADRRIANASAQPYGIRMWCLGNEMDGPWQLGYLTAEDYGKLAARTAAAMKAADSHLELVLCGSSGDQMPTFGSWERTVLEHAYDHVDYISAHSYWEINDGDVESFLAASVGMQRFIDTVVAAADEIQHARKAERQIHVSFDEWNVWRVSEWVAANEAASAAEVDGDREWPVAPRLLEESYTVADAVVIGSLLITLLKNSDRVRSASLAQLVNVIAPIMTEPGGLAWRQTTFYPFAVTSRLAAGDVLRPNVVAPTGETTRYGLVAMVDAVATADAETGDAAVFLVNRSLTEEITVEVAIGELGVTRVTEVVAIFDGDVNAQNTLADPQRVSPQVLPTHLADDGTLTVAMPPVSWAAIALS